MDVGRRQHWEIGVGVGGVGEGGGGGVATFILRRGGGAIGLGGARAAAAGCSCCCGGRGGESGGRGGLTSFFCSSKRVFKFVNPASDCGQKSTSRNSELDLAELHIHLDRRFRLAFHACPAFPLCHKSRNAYKGWFFFIRVR